MNVPVYIHFSLLFILPFCSKSFPRNKITLEEKKGEREKQGVKGEMGVGVGGRGRRGVER